MFNVLLTMIEYDWTLDFTHFWWQWWSGRLLIRSSLLDSVGLVFWAQHCNLESLSVSILWRVRAPLNSKNSIEWSSLICVDLDSKQWRRLTRLDSTSQSSLLASDTLLNVLLWTEKRWKSTAILVWLRKKNDFQHSNGSTLLCCVLTLGFPTFQVLRRVFSKHLFLPTLLQPWHLEKVFPNPLALPACLVKVRLVAVALYVACFCLYVKCWGWELSFWQIFASTKNAPPSSTLPQKKCKTTCLETKWIR